MSGVDGLTVVGRLLVRKCLLICAPDAGAVNNTSSASASVRRVVVMLLKFKLARRSIERMAVSIYSHFCLESEKKT